MKYLILLVSVFAFVACNKKSISQTKEEVRNKDTPLANAFSHSEKVVKTDEEWKAQLTDLEYKVLRKAGTERPHTGDLLNNKEDGIYTCRGCQLPLFDSDTKYKSGTGWPSYYQPISETNVGTDTDYKLGYARSEVHCNRCDGHLGHVFNDGPEPTGLRYCINSVSLDFKARDKGAEH